MLKRILAGAFLIAALGAATASPADARAQWKIKCESMNGTVVGSSPAGCVMPDGSVW